MLPAIYNQNLARYNWNPPEPTPIPEECAQQAVINVKLENENMQLKETITHLQNRIGSEDLTIEEMAELQESLLDDDGDENDESFNWLIGAQDDIPAPIGSVKVEPESMDDSELTPMETNNSEEDDFDPPTNTTTQQNESVHEPNASTSAIMSPPPNRQQNTPAVAMDLHSDKVAGFVQFTLNVNILSLSCMQ